MLAFLAFLVSLCIAQVDIRPEHRVFNASGKQCVWASLETVGRHFGIAALYDLTACYKGPCSCRLEAIEVLNSRGMSGYWSPSSEHDWQSLQNAMARHWPAAVCIEWDKHASHMLLIVDVTENSVKVIDNCGKKSLQVQEWSRKWFDEHWNGWWIVISQPNGR